MIKMSPVIKRATLKRDCISTIVVFMGQHKDTLQQLAVSFGIEPDFFLDVMQQDQSLASLTAKLLMKIDR